MHIFHMVQGRIYHTYETYNISYMINTYHIVQFKFWGKIEEKQESNGTVKMLLATELEI